MDEATTHLQVDEGRLRAEWKMARYMPQHYICSPNTDVPCKVQHSMSIARESSAPRSSSTANRTHHGEEGASGIQEVDIQECDERLQGRLRLVRTTAQTVCMAKAQERCPESEQICHAGRAKRHRSLHDSAPARRRRCSGRQSQACLHATESRRQKVAAQEPGEAGKPSGRTAWQKVLNRHEELRPTRDRLAARKAHQ
jgi:hypothetical protein